MRLQVFPHLCGPYSGEQAAAIVLGIWKPTPTGHLCAQCRPMVAASAQNLADRIDAAALEHALNTLGKSNATRG